ncbi:hypothetical protein ACFOUP_09065 [Belliella kenyensis]|uniref:Uncharacterized protein n=1 Tax=Belliella kenyensis TaxID=1472724 RepID=A0ABV8ENE1_9BACT|nr:hypothetical protein [Belliella kenyensis]MCH7403243.1 hypothetical protein [Belliella kenyensis]MDN3604854.1 hypothetical protein [Belliella kenyensis]
MRKLTIIILLIISSFELVSGQGLYSPGSPQDDGRFASSTKQVNQFFRRFNGEESADGSKRYYDTDAEYRDRTLRGKFISILFDNETSNVESQLKSDFLKEVLSENLPQYLAFHRGEWFSEVETTFIYKGKRENVTLFMKLQPEGLGYEWVVDKVNFAPFKNLFKKPVGDQKSFLHPMSHEIGFMNLRKAFQDSKLPEAYTPKEYEPDYLTLFLYEIKNGNLKFDNVLDVKFHFFQIDNWYFEVNQFNRPGFNTGWLISNLIKLKPGEKDVVQRYIYDQK